MKRRILCSLLVVALLATLLVAAVPTAAAADASLTAFFDSYTSKSGSFTLTNDARIFVVSANKPAGMLLSTIQLASSRLAAKGLPSSAALPIAYGAASDARNGDIVLLEDSSLPEEGFRLELTASNAMIYYCAGASRSYYGGEGSYNSLHYGFQALMRLFSGNKASCCSVADTPDTAERTVQLDIGRKYWSVNWIKNLIDEMSWMGYNAMDLHLTEDQGCRSNIWRDSSGNTVLDCNGNDFSWMIGYNTVSWNENCTDPNKDKFYNRDELREIVEYAKSRHIEIIPAVDWPTHADCLIAKFKSNFVDQQRSFSYNYGGQTFSGCSTLEAGNNATINVTNAYTRNLSFAITQAYADFFGELGCSKFNIGGDEVSGASYSWGDSDYTTGNGGTCGNPKDAYVIYMNQLAAVVKTKSYGSDNHGYSVRAWNDCLFGVGYYYYNQNGRQTQYTGSASVSVDPDIEVCFWTASTSHTSPSTLANQGRKVYNCVNWYTYYVLRHTNTSNTDYSRASGDARDDSCTQWTFNHGSAQRVYSGCGNSCTYSCQHTGGWRPSDFNGCTNGYFTDQYVSGSSLGGGYFLIWGDWAGLDTEENIWNRTDNYGLIDRMWANAAKMWNEDADGSVNYASFVAMNSSARTFPGFNGCTSAATVPTPGVLYGEETVQIQLKTKVGTAEKLLKTITVQAMYASAFQAQIPVQEGYVYERTDGASFLPAASGKSCGTVYGVATGGTQIVTVWFENSPYLGLLEFILAHPATNKGYVNYETYQNAVNNAQTFLDRVSASAKSTTQQSEINQYIVKILLAQIALSKSGTELPMECYLESDYVSAGKVAVVHVDSGSNVTDVNIAKDGQSVQRLVLASRQNADGSKSWRVNIRMPETAGTYVYTVTITKQDGTTESKELTIEVK